MAETSGHHPRPGNTYVATLRGLTASFLLFLVRSGVGAITLTSISQSGDDDDVSFEAETTIDRLLIVFIKPHLFVLLLIITLNDTMTNTVWMSFMAVTTALPTASAFQPASLSAAAAKTSSLSMVAVDPSTVTPKEYEDICGVSFDDDALEKRLQATNYLYPKHVEVIEDIAPIAGEMTDKIVSLRFKSSFWFIESCEQTRHSNDTREEMTMSMLSVALLDCTRTDALLLLMLLMSS